MPTGRPVEFSVVLGQYEGTVRIARRSFSISSIGRRRQNDASKRLISSGPGSKLVVERKLRRRQLTDDGNVEINGRDLRERDHGSMPFCEQNYGRARQGSH
jgi:hypothetical protein